MTTRLLYLLAAAAADVLLRTLLGWLWQRLLAPARNDAKEGRGDE